MSRSPRGRGSRRQRIPVRAPKTELDALACIRTGVGGCEDDGPRYGRLGSSAVAAGVCCQRAGALRKLCVCGPVRVCLRLSVPAFPNTHGRGCTRTGCCQMISQLPGLHPLQPRAIHPVPAALGLRTCCQHTPPANPRLVLRGSPCVSSPNNRQPTTSPHLDKRASTSLHPLHPPARRVRGSISQHASRVSPYPYLYLAERPHFSAAWWPVHP